LKQSFVLFNFENYLDLPENLPLVSKGVASTIQLATTLIPTLSSMELLKILEIFASWIDGISPQIDHSLLISSQKQLSESEKNLLLSHLPKTFICRFLGSCAKIRVNKSEGFFFISFFFLTA